MVSQRLILLLLQSLLYMPDLLSVFLTVSACGVVGAWQQSAVSQRHHRPRQHHQHASLTYRDLEGVEVCLHAL